MEINLIAETVKFLILGMSTVFMFLILMVFVLEIQSKIITKFFPQKKEEISHANAVSHKAQHHLAVVAAIVASIKSHKQSK
ncbi:MAG: OadG family protein [Sulfurospirillum sp.]|jgi:oxaloacetate decarboxylase gamma subunit|nr:OadG family protein [Sulfurospirillum sp.]MBP9492206.1 OadG family protein [Sulfurospirillum sp.]MBP9612733.1 OadG family protein [Sulfurospirillum sp.]